MVLTAVWPIWHKAQLLLAVRPFWLLSQRQIDIESDGPFWLKTCAHVMLVEGQKIGKYAKTAVRTIWPILGVIFRLYGEKPPLYRLEPKFAWWDGG